MRRIPEKIIQEIQNYRRLGYSLPEIARLVSASRSGIYRHIRNLAILAENLPEWSIKRGGSHKIKLQKQQYLNAEISQLIPILTKQQKPLCLSALYWAEGCKKDFSLCNTDPKLIQTLINFMRDCFKLPNDRFRVSSRTYEDLDQEKCSEFWSNTVNIAKCDFHSINVLQGKKKGKLQYGMCRVRVTNGGGLLKTISAVNNVVASFAVAPVAQMDRAPQS